MKIKLVSYYNSYKPKTAKVTGKLAAESKSNILLENVASNGPIVITNTPVRCYPYQEIDDRQLGNKIRNVVTLIKMEESEDSLNKIIVTGSKRPP